MKSLFRSFPNSLALLTALSLSLFSGSSAFAQEAEIDAVQPKKPGEAIIQAGKEKTGTADKADKKDADSTGKDKPGATSSGERAAEGEKKETGDKAADAATSTPAETKQEDKGTARAASLLPATGEFSVEGIDKEHESERREIESILTMIETQWNAHDIKAVMNHYADDYVNNDGLGKAAMQKLTEEFWKTYPDARCLSKVKKIRIEGNFAIVDSRDISVATTDMNGMTDGELQSVSEGQQYFKRLGNIWKITGDRVDFEKVRLAFGLAKQLNAVFTAPEQVRAGKQFSARLEVSLPPGLQALGSITNQPLTFPQHTPIDKPRDLNSDQQPPVLERVMTANNENRNELLTGSVILITPSRKPRGLCYFTRRLNVVPDQPDADALSIAKESTKGKVASESARDNKEGSVESAADKGTEDKNSQPAK